jgi:SPP1 family phage portal protein
MDAKQLADIIAAHGIKQEDYYENEAYYRGRNPAIFAKTPQADPDYRVPVPFIKLAIDTLAGYMAKPGNISYSGPGYDDYLMDVFNANEETLITQDEFKKACVHGESYELHWYDGAPMFATIPTIQGIPVFSDDLKPRLEGFVRVWKAKDDTDRATHYGPDTVQEWARDKQSWTLISEELHGYGKVPVVIYRVSTEARNIFDHVKELIDAFDRLVSHDLANELERFAKAYLLYANRLEDIPDDTGQTAIDRIKQARTFEDLGDNVSSKVAFLTKNIQSDFIRFSAETFQDLIYEMMQVPNPRDVKTFSGASGYAMMLKNMSFEFLCASIEGNFIRGLQDRVRLILGHKLVNVPANDVVIKMQRNLPNDLEMLARVSAQLSGTWDKESILKIFPESMLTAEDRQRIIDQGQDQAASLADLLTEEPEADDQR